MRAPSFGMSRNALEIVARHLKEITAITTTKAIDCLKIRTKRHRKVIESYVKSTATPSAVVRLTELEANWNDPVPPSLEKITTVADVLP